jgi:hypothetical protein
MIIPMSDNNLGRLICTLNGLCERYKYRAYIIKEFPDLITFFMEKDNYTIPEMMWSVNKEITVAERPNFQYHKIQHYRNTLKDFREYLISNYEDEYPEILL